MAATRVVLQWTRSRFNSIFRQSSVRGIRISSFDNRVSLLSSTVTNNRYYASSATTLPQQETYEFQAETKKLLDIVARSLYSEKEVFIRELISNASDSIERMRYLSGTNDTESLISGGRELKIDIETDKIGRTITIKDNGLGMTKEELIENLGTIARSGSKAFLQSLEQEGHNNEIIGQFGVGFYSAFMVADSIDVYSKSSYEGSRAFHWRSDGVAGSYSIEEISNDTVDIGTKIVVHLKDSCGEFCDENVVKDVIKKYSSFVGSPLTINGTASNELRPIWLMDPKDVTSEQYHNFYNYVSNSFDKPRFIQHYRTEAPMDVKALLFVPESRPGLFETSKDREVGVALYCRKVLIKSKTENIIPNWMRFVKGVIDSEDIPLNLSRELLQDSAQIRRLRTVITNKFLRFMQDRAKKETPSYYEFYKDYNVFLKEGIVTSHEQNEKEELAKLLRFETSTHPEGELRSITDYCADMKAGQRDIYYLAAPSRQLAENSPYFEALKRKDVEIIFCYESYDELVFMQLQQFNKMKLTSVEKEMRSQDDEGKDKSSEDSKQEDVIRWIQDALGPKCAKVKITNKLETHPCVITVEEMAAARHFIKTQGANYSEEQRYHILQPRLEINASHPLIQKIHEIKTSNPKLAHLITEQLFVNAMVSAGLVEDPRTILKSMNELLMEALKS